MKKKNIVVTRCSSEVDVVFALDGSDNVSASEFIQQQAFITSQTVLYDISPSKIQMGAFAYGEGTSNISGFSPFRDGKELISFVSSLTPPKGASSLILALNLTWDILSSEGRHSAKKIGFIFTSGPMSNTTSTANFVQFMKNSNITVVLVGVGPEFNETDMETVAGNRSHVLKADTFDSLFSIAHSVRSLICIESPSTPEEAYSEQAQKRNSRLSVWNIHDIPKLDPTAKKGLAHDEQRNSIVLQDRVVNASVSDNATFESSYNSTKENDNDMFVSSVNNTYAISFEGIGNDTHNNSLLYSPLQIQNETIEGEISAELVSNLSAGMYNLSAGSAPLESWPSNTSYSKRDPFNTTDDSDEDIVPSSDISSGGSLKDDYSTISTLETVNIHDSLLKNVSNGYATPNSAMTAFLFDTSSNLLNSTETVNDISDMKHEQSRTNKILKDVLSPKSSIQEYDSKLKRQFFDATFDLLKTMHLPNERNKTQTQKLEESMLASNGSGTDNHKDILEHEDAKNKRFQHAPLDPFNVLINSSLPRVPYSSPNINIENNEPSETYNLLTDGKGVDPGLKIQSVDNQSDLAKAVSIQSEESKLGDTTKMESPLQLQNDHAVYESSLRKKLFEAPFELLQTNVRRGKQSTDIIKNSDNVGATNLAKPNVETYNSFTKKTFFDAPFDPLKTEIKKSLQPPLSEYLEHPLSFRSDSNSDKKAHESTLKKKLFDSPFDLLKTIVSNKTDMKTSKSPKEKTLTDSAEQEKPILQTAYTFDFSNKIPDKESQSTMAADPASAPIAISDTIKSNDPTFDLNPAFTPDTVKMIDVNKDQDNTKTDKTPVDHDEDITTKDTDNTLKHISLESGLKKSFFDSGFDFLKTKIGVRTDIVKPTVENRSKETLGEKGQQITSSVHDGKTRKKFFDSSFELLKTIVPIKEIDGVVASILAANETKSKSFNNTRASNQFQGPDISFPKTLAKKEELSPMENSDEEATTTYINRTSDEKLTKKAEQITNLTSKSSDVTLVHPKYTSTDLFKEKTRPSHVKLTNTNVSGDSKTTIYEANLEKKFFDSSIYMLSTVVKEKIPESLLSSKSGEAGVSTTVLEPILKPHIANQDGEHKHKTIPPEIDVVSQSKPDPKAMETLPKEKPEIGSILKRKFFDTLLLSKTDVSRKQPDLNILQSHANVLSKDLTKIQRASSNPVNGSQDDEDTDFSPSKMITGPKTDASSRSTPETEPGLLEQFFHFSASVPKHSQPMENPIDSVLPPPPPIIPGQRFLPPPPSPPADVTESFGMQNLRTSEAHSFRTFTFPVVGAGKRDMKHDGRISESADTDTFAGDFLNANAMTSTLSAVKDTGQIFHTQTITTVPSSFTKGPKSFKVPVENSDPSVNAELQQINEIASQARSSRAFPAGLEDQALKELRKLQLKRALMSRVTALTDRKLLPPQQMAQLKDKLIAVMKARAMKSRHIQDEVCQESPLETDPSFYKQRIGNETVVRPCPLGTLFNATACGCSINHVAETFTPCNAELLMEFEQDYEDHSGMASAVGAKDVTIEKGSAHFTGSSQLTIWRFSGTHIGSQLDIKVRFKPMPSRFKTQHLIGNCDMDLPMTYGMELDTEREVILFFIQTEIRGKAVLELKYNPITWNDARLRYDGLEFSAIVNSDRKSVPLGGNVVNRHVPLVIGTCDEKSGGFTGHIDK
ncbi:hypothetical protein ACJMK2_010957, partial [Sinanodonta woodiana]